MRRVAVIGCIKCKQAIAEICVEEVQETEPDTFVPQVDEMRQYFGIPPYYCAKCVEANLEEANND